jgi:hypothetical protein
VHALGDAPARARPRRSKYEGANAGFWWAWVSRGTYRDDSFDAVQDDWVCDVAREPDTDRQDTHIELWAYFGDDGAITWAELDFEPER